MTDTNISKTDLENICQALGIVIDGVKVDLIQRLRKHLKGKSHAGSNDTELTRRNEEEGQDTTGLDHLSDTSEIDLNHQARTLRELAHLSRKETEPRNSLDREQSLSLENDRLESKQNSLNKKRLLSNDEDCELTESKILTEFKQLESAVLTMNDKLNTVTAQAHDTKQKVEVNETWQKYKFEKSHDQHEYDALRKIGKELDLAMESRSTMEVMDHINNAREIASNRIFTLRVAEGYGWDIASALPDTQNDWMKGKDLLIEKAKTLVEVKKKSFFGPTIGAKTVTQTLASVTSVKDMDIMRVNTHQTQIKTTTNIELTTHENIPLTKANTIEAITMETMKTGSMIDYIWAQYHIPVTGRLHMRQYVNYWKTKIQPSELIINWLKNGIPLFPKKLLVLANQPDPPHYPLTEEQNI
ncbi:12480_t:CDS:2, partial [Acaulospora morrowiae]